VSKFVNNKMKNEDLNSSINKGKNLIKFSSRDNYANQPYKPKNDLIHRSSSLNQLNQMANKHLHNNYNNQ